MERVNERVGKRVFKWKCNSRYSQPVVAAPRVGHVDSKWIRPERVFRAAPAVDGGIYDSSVARGSHERGRTVISRQRDTSKDVSPWRPTQGKRHTKQENQIQRPLLVRHRLRRSSSSRGNTRVLRRLSKLYKFFIYVRKKFIIQFNFIRQR